MDNSTISVQIAGRDYNLTSADSAEHMRRMAAYVDRKMRELMAAGPMTRESAAVMAALTISDELLKSQDDNTRLRRKLDEAHAL